MLSPQTSRGADGDGLRVGPVERGVEQGVIHRALLGKNGTNTVKVCDLPSSRLPPRPTRALRALVKDGGSADKSAERGDFLVDVLWNRDRDRSVIFLE